MEGTDKMRVLEVNVDDIGTGGVYALVKNVIYNKSENLDIDIAAIVPFENENNKLDLEKRNTKIFYIGAKNKIIRPFAYIIKLSSLIKKNKYNCVHIHSDVSYVLLPLLLGAKIGGAKKILLHSHAAGIDGENRKIKLFLHLLCRKYLEQPGVTCLACSDVAAKWMYPNISNKNIILINNGIDVEKYKYSEKVRKEIRSKLGVSDELVIGHIGRFAYQKNHNYLLEIFKHIKIREGNAKLLLIGEGPLYREVKEKAEMMNLTDIIFVGVTDKVQDFLQAIDVFVLPSFFEGLPIVGVEAQASGVPCIFSDSITRETKLVDEVVFLPINSESIDKWVNGIISYKKHIRRDNSLLLVNRGFDIKKTVRNLTDLYKQKY